MLRDSSVKHVIAHNIKKFRELNGIKQSELASVIGTTNKNISNWENEVSSPDMDTLHNIAAALGVTMNDIFSDDESLSMEFGKPTPDFYKRITESLTEKGLSTQEMCEKINLPYAVYRNYEKSSSGRISLSVISDIINILEVSPTYLMGWEDGNGNISDISESQLEEIKASSIHIHKGIITRYNLLSDENKKIIAANIEFLLNQQGVSGKGE